MNDLIYYDELKNKLLALESEANKLPCYSEEDYAYNNGVVNGIEACIEELDNIPSVWHKPDEKPKEKSWIFAWFKGLFDCAWDSAFYSNGEYSNGEWSTKPNKRSPGIKIPESDVIAWMYFPELPDDFV